MQAATVQRLGDILVAQGAVSRARLETAVAQAYGRLGQALHSHGLISGPALAKAVAAQHALPVIDLGRTPPVAKLFLPRDYPHYITHHYVPVGKVGNTLTLATSEPSDALVQFARSHYRCEIALMVTTARELAHYHATRAATASTRRARLTLRRMHPTLGADRTVLRHQLRGIALLAGAMLTMMLMAPHIAWYVLLVACNLFYVATLIIKLVFYREGSRAARSQQQQAAALTTAARGLEDAHLPVYSILVPMYRESSAVMARLIQSLSALDYPKEKLDIILILEADDTDSIAALKALAPPAFMRIMAVPPSAPRTKPKACNVALQSLRGEYAVIYDAEDAPAPDQLKLALVMFQQGPVHLACVQARLNYYNRSENILTQMFALEYSALFRLLLPALERLGLPIPLGGTSNHLNVAALRAVGGWDAFNVTEDADLGVRLAYLGYTTHTLASLTLEESPITLKAWMMQRTRWIKGYLQTWLVYTRDTRQLKARLGSMGYYGFQFFIGAPALTFLLAPFFWAAFILSLTGAFGDVLPLWMQLICAFSFVGGALSHWLFARKAMEIEGWHGMRAAIALYPFYWLLHSFAAARALWQLAIAPHYWEKTMHGVSRTFASDGLSMQQLFAHDTLFSMYSHAAPSAKRANKRM